MWQISNSFQLRNPIYFHEHITLLQNMQNYSANFCPLYLCTISVILCYHATTRTSYLVIHKMWFTIHLTNEWIPWLKSWSSLVKPILIQIVFKTIVKVFTFPDTTDLLNLCSNIVADNLITDKLPLMSYSKWKIGLGSLFSKIYATSNLNP